jgi:hypothetical protein
VNDAKEALRSLIGGLIGGLSVVYVSGYLVLSARFVAYRITSPQVLFADEYLLAGAKFCGNVLFMGLYAALPITLLAIAWRVVARWLPSVIARIHKHESVLAVPLHWATVVAIAVMAIGAAPRFGAAHPDEALYQLALVLAALSVALSLWLRAVRAGMPATLGAALSGLQIINVPIVFGMYVEPPLLPLAELTRKSGDNTLAEESGALLYQSNDWWALLHDGGTVQILRAETIESADLNGCWSLSRNGKVECDDKP